jgi:hypothetical protein
MLKKLFTKFAANQWERKRYQKVNIVFLIDAVMYYNYCLYCWASEVTNDNS